MELSFSKDELKALLELSVIADWVMTAHDNEDDERKDPYIKLVQKIYAFAHKNGMTKEIEHLEDVQEFFPDETWEEKSLARAFISEFEEKTFWDELIERLAERELNLKLQGNETENFQHHMEIFEEFAGKYANEFAENGIANLDIIASKPGKK